MNKESFCETVARRAGRIMVKYFYEEKRVDWKDDHTPVTVADRRINQHVISMVDEYYPDDDVLGEEQSSVENTSNRVWVCDPIDGTTPFSHGIPTATFSLAHVVNGEVITAVIYDPWEDRLYYASQGDGTVVNGEPVSVNDKDSVSDAVFGLEASASSPYPVGDIRGELDQRGANVLGLMSSNYTSMLIASGELSGLVYAGDKPYDGAAVKLIVEEAGGRVTDVYGGEQRYDEAIQGYVASNSRLHDQLLDVLPR